MNTASWGPKTWVYTHTVAQNYKILDRWTYKRFFTILEDILPCKYCRASYQEFITELPMDSYMNNQKDFTKWYYMIHNKVNDKLRDQGYIHTRNPSFRCIYRKYDRLLKSITNLDNVKASDCMWYFLHAISFNFDPKLHNAQKYIEAFNLVGETMPYPLVKPIYQRLLKDYPPQMYMNSLPRWLYNIHKQINRSLGFPDLNSFAAVERKFNAIRSDCNKPDKNLQKKETIAELSSSTNTCRIPDSKIRCKAATIRGRQCIKCNSNGSAYCSQHQRLLPPRPLNEMPLTAAEDMAVFLSIFT